MRVAEPDISNLPAADREVVDQTIKRRGALGLLQLDYALFHSFPLAKGWNAFFSALKKELNKLTVDDKLYYSVLEQWGYKKSSEIPDKPSGVAVYKSMAAALKALKQRNADWAEMMDHRERLGLAFWNVADEWEKETLGDITNEQLTALLAKLREVK